MAIGGDGTLRRLSRRLSRRVGDLTRQRARPMEMRLTEKERRMLAEVAELTNFNAPKLQESNALTETGQRVVDNIAGMVERRVAAEDRTNEDDAFSLGGVPPISVADYFSRLARYVNVWRGHAGGPESAGVRAAVMTLIYLEKLEKMRPDFAVNRTNVHRIAMAGFLVATKFTEDAPISSQFWAKVGGVRVSEVNQLEAAFCDLLEFNLYIDEVAYAQHLDEYDLPDF